MNERQYTPGQIYFMLELAVKPTQEQKASILNYIREHIIEINQTLLDTVRKGEDCFYLDIPGF